MRDRDLLNFCKVDDWMHGTGVQGKARKISNAQQGKNETKKNAKRIEKKRRTENRSWLRV